MTELQNHLQTHSLSSLSSYFQSPIIVKQHPNFSNLILLKYKQASGKHLQHKEVRQARGIIVDSDDNYKIISYGYDKYFNYHEKYAPKEHEIDWNTVRVTEKADGTLMCLYFYKEKWRLSTTGQADAGESLNCPNSFASMFWDIWNKLKMKLPSKEHQHIVFMFELMTLKNRIIVRMEEAGHGEIIWLHGARNMDTLTELLPYEYGDLYNWPVVKEYTTEECLPKEFHGHWTLPKVVRYVSGLPPTKSEGVVVCDKNFQRIKVKSPSYVALMHLNVKEDNKMKATKMLQIIKSSEGSEFLSYYEQWKDLHNSMEKDFNKFCNKIDKLYKEKQEGEQTNSCSKSEKEALESYITNNTNGIKYSCSSDFFRDPIISVGQLAHWMNLQDKYSTSITFANPNKIVQNDSIHSKSNKPRKSNTTPISTPKGFTISQPSYTEKRKKELDNLDSLIDSFIENDKKPSPVQPNKSKQKVKHKKKKGKGKKKGKKK